MATLTHFPAPGTASLAASPARKQRRWRTVFLVVAIAAAAALIGGFVALRRFKLPAPTGPFAVGTSLLDLTDQTRHEPHEADPAARRELVVQLWYPAQAVDGPTAPYARWRETRAVALYEALLRTHAHPNAPLAASGKPFPVILFSHRWGGERTQNTALAEELASQGFVVASIDFPYNASRVLLGNSRVVTGHEVLEGPHGPSASAAEQIAFWNQTLELWAADERFVLDQLAARATDPVSPFFQRLDTDNAGALGHSFGGAAAFRLCGLDPRIRAAVNLDGWTFGALRDRTSAQQILVMYEGISQERERALAKTPGPGTTEDQLDRADFATVDADLERFGGYRAFVAGTQHLDFADQPLLPPLRRTYTGPIAPREVNALLRASVTQFFTASLRGGPAPLLAGASSTGTTSRAFPELLLQHWAANTNAVTAPAPRR